MLEGHCVEELRKKEEGKKEVRRGKHFQLKPKRVTRRKKKQKNMSAVVDVNDAPGEGCKCSRKNLPVVVLILGFVANFLTGLVCVLDLLQFSGVPQVILDLYLLILAALAFSAELRMFKPLRSIIYTWMKFVYFLTSYTGRGLFYVFMGSVLIGETVLSYIAGGCVIAAGIVIVVGNCVFGLPVYMDWQVAKANANEERRRQQERNFVSPTGDATPTAGSYSPPNTGKSNSI